jgi:acyl-coenzyme A thioesterase PaaI-like protein
MGVTPLAGAKVPFQDLMPFNHCWGCGADNPDGLRLKSRWSIDDADEALATFRSGAEHVAGPAHVLNGGIIATVLDCHGVCTAVADAYRQEGRTIGAGETIWFATGTLTVTYERPAPVGAELELRARVIERSARTTAVECALDVSGERCARADLVAVRVPASWLEPQPSGP